MSVIQKIKKIRPLLFAACLFLASCTCPGIIGSIMTDQDFVTEHGLNIHPQGNWVAPEEIERATELAIIDVSSFFTMPVYRRKN